MNTQRNVDLHTATENARIADRLQEMADLSESQDDHPFRARAYHQAAATVRSLPFALSDLLDREGEAGLTALPTIGAGIASAIAEMIRTGRWRALEELGAERGGAVLFKMLPGIGPMLAARLHDTLAVESFAELEQALHDGRVEEVDGFGPARIAMLRAELQRRLRRVRRHRPPLQEPSVDTLLEVDREYRERAASGGLETIAPRRFNPDGRSWLPVLRTRRDPWQFSALYSNTAAAHRADRTHDWVVIYFRDATGREGQRTVVTETRGPRSGERVVRGRETETPSPHASLDRRPGKLPATSIGGNPMPEMYRG